MNVRLAVGGLLTRNAVLSALLLNYADRLDQECYGHGTATAPCFIVPTWTVDQRPSAPQGSQVLTVEAHTSRNDPRRHENPDSILALLHTVLTDDQASGSITTRRLPTSPDLVPGGRGTVCKVGAWEIALAPARPPGSAQPQRLPWPDCNAVTAAGFLTPGTAVLN
jgi:hypothetical protein